MPSRKLLVEVVGDSRSLERAFGRSSKSAKSFGRDMDRATGRVKRSFTRSISGASAALIGGAGLVAAFTSTISKAAEFEKGLNVLQSVSGATADQMERVRQVATKLGGDITLPATSAKDAAEAMTELAKGGLSVQNAMDAARGSLQLAAAAQITAAEASEITARQLNAFGLEGREAGRVADVLANLANVATGEISDFAFAFQSSSAVAHQFGLSVEQAGAALAILANRGVVGSDAGTSLRTMLTRLVPQTKKAAATMKDLGIVWKDANDEVLPFRKLLVQYHKVLKRLPSAQRQAAVQTIFGSDAQRAANIIFGNSVQVYDDMVDKVSKQGAAARLAAAQNKGYTGALDALKSAIETVQIQLGTKLLPVLTRYLQAAAKWLGNTKNQRLIMDTLADAAAALASVVKALRGAFQGLNRITGSTRRTLKLLLGVLIAIKTLQMVGALAGIASNIGLIGRNAKKSGGEVKGLGRQLAYVKGFGPTLAIAIVISLIVKNKKEISDWLRSVGLDAIASGIQNVGGLIRPRQGSGGTGNRPRVGVPSLRSPTTPVPSPAPPRLPTRPPPRGTRSLQGATVVNVGTVVTQDPDKFVRDMQKKAARTRAQQRGVRPGVALGGA